MKEKELAFKLIPDKPISLGEIWDILHIMMVNGQIIRYRIKGVCDVTAPTGREKEPLGPYLPRFKPR